MMAHVFKINIIKLFLQIPEHTIKNMQDRTEQFIFILQDGDFDASEVSSRSKKNTYPDDQVLQNKAVKNKKR